MTKGFFARRADEDGNDPRRKRRPSEANATDKARAKRLFDYVVSRGWRVSSSKRNWADALRRLRKQFDNADGGDSLIDRIIDFIVETKLDKPKIRDGQELIDRFRWLEDLYDKHREKGNDNLVISEKMQKLADDLASTCGWPPGTKIDLPVVCQLTYNNYSTFFDKLLTYLKKNDERIYNSDGETFKINRWWHIADDALARMGSPGNFTARWLRIVNRKLQSWPGFTGTLKTFVWRTEMEMALYHGRGVVERYTGHPGDWDKLLKELETA